MTGTKRLYNFVHNNPILEMLDIAYVNDTDVIRQNPKVTAINSDLEAAIQRLEK
jgi:acyl-CoA hydrolase